MEKPLLIDLDGVLRIGREPAPHIEQFLEYLEQNSINSCILSNSSLYNSKQIYDFFESYSISINFPIITAIDAAQAYIEKKYRRVAVYTSDNVIGQFADYLDFENPEAVLIGDIGNVWNYKLIQTIFEYVQNGAELIAAHKNKFWNKPDIGIQLDAGPFIHAIEFASSKQATLIGKPSPLYFELALDKINCKLSESFIMLGDDLDSDMAGAKVLGARTILIYTGKTIPPFPAEYDDNIDYEAEDLIEVRNLLERIKS
jgi:HAD superfamily hydrolase (TIGR01458 family)